MKQRLGIAFAILDNPDFIILDEPINGLDPIGISELREEWNKCIVIKVQDAKKASVILEQELNTKNYKILNNSEIRLYDYLENSSKVNKTLIKNDIDVISLYEAGITLEDYFKSIIKEEA